MKTFYAKTMSAAMEQVKAEFGAEALLLSTRKIPTRIESDALASGYEVVAATDESQQEDIASFSVPGCQASAAAAAAEAVESDPPGLKSSLRPWQMMAASPSRLSGRQSADQRRGRRTMPASVEESHFWDAASLKLYGELTAQGVHEWLARRMLTAALYSMPPKQRRTRSALMKSISRCARDLVAEGKCKDGLPAKRVVVFVGPTGVGKTTSIAKLAAHLTLAHHKKVILMTMDGYRIGAVEQLRTYASLMGVPFRFISQASELPNAIKENSQRDYLLIDTAGRAPRDLSYLQEIMEALAGFEEVERHLVLSATTKPSDLCSIVDQFESCRPDHLVFTKLDETTTLGPILNELVRTRKPVSYYTDGQRVPDDFHAGGRDRLVEMVLQHN